MSDETRLRLQGEISRLELAAASDAIDAGKTINLLVDALEKIDDGWCPLSGIAQGASERRCGVCPSCIAHEALETFRGR